MDASMIRPELEVVCAFGGLSALVGLVALLAWSRRRRPHSAGRVLGVAGVLGVLGGGLALAGQSPLLWQPPAAFALLFAVLAVLRSTAVGGACVGLGRLVSAPLFQAFLLLMLGAATLVGQGWYLDHLAFPEIDLGDVGLESPADLEPLGELAYTDAGQAIPLFTLRASGESSAEDDEERAFRNNPTLLRQVMQTAEPNPSYNCHGWVFADGKAWVRGSFVERILADNRYATVERPSVGDVAVFRDSAGEVTHTALVRAVTADGRILLESKWGRLGRFLHTPTDHVYRTSSVRYYRSDRANHSLRRGARPQAQTAAS